MLVLLSKRQPDRLAAPGPECLRAGDPHESIRDNRALRDCHVYRAGRPLEVRLASSGKPLPGPELRVVDPATNQPLRPGERGELVGRGPCRFEGYYRNEEATRAVIDKEGWFHTGDLACMDEEGRFTMWAA